MKEKAKIEKPNYTQVSNDFIDKWMSKLSNPAVKIYIAITRKTVGWHKDTDRISYSQLIKLTGLSKNGIKNAIKELIEYELIDQTETKFGYSYDLILVSNGDPLVSNGDPLVSNGDPLVSNGDPTKETNIKYTNLKETILNKEEFIVQENNIPPNDFINKETKEKENPKHQDDNIEIYNTIINGLNKMTGHNFKANNNNTIKLIKARLKAGYSVDDFAKVIMVKCKQWKTDNKMKEYLCPSTLFGNKFENYLEEYNIKKEYHDLSDEDKYLSFKKTDEFKQVMRMFGEVV